MTKSRRPETLTGPTYSTVLPDETPMYVTINYDGENVVEVFVRLDKAELYEWVSIITIFITRLLRAGQTLDTIAEEMQEVFNPQGGYHHKGQAYHSIVAHIGRIFEKHLEEKDG